MSTPRISVLLATFISFLFVGPAATQDDGWRTIEFETTEVTAPDVTSSDTISIKVSEGTKLAFDLSPDGRTIVFDLLGQLWTFPVEGGVAVPLTEAVRDRSEDLDPAFSPDGKSVVFRADRPGGAGLYIVSLEDRTIRRLTTKPEESFVADAAPSWAPDGRHLAFVRGQAIQVLDVADGELRQLQIDSLPDPAASHPTWSPDGARLVFANASLTARGGGRLWVVPAGGGVARPLTRENDLARAPVYAPDGYRVAFFALDSSDRFQLWLMEPNDEPIQLTSHADVTPLRARWFPDGSSILYHADGRLWRIPAVLARSPRSASASGSLVSIPSVAPVSGGEPAVVQQ